MTQASFEQLRPFVGSRISSGPDEKQQKASIIVLDQRELSQCLIAAWISATCSDSNVVTISGTSGSLNKVSLSDAELVVVGLSITDSGFSWLKQQTDALRAIRQDLPLAAIIDVGDDPSIVTRINQAGITNYVPITINPRAAAAALRLIAAGEQYQPKLPSGQPQSEREFRDYDRQDSVRTINKLTPRERSVLDLLRMGIPNKVIAYRLGLSQSTVKAHVHSVISKLEVRNRTEAALKGRLLMTGMADGLSPLADLGTLSSGRLRSGNAAVPIDRAAEATLALVDVPFRAQG